MNKIRKTYSEGVLEGREQRALEIARSLKREGLPEDVIYRITGFRGEALKQELKVMEKPKNL